MKYEDYSQVHNVVDDISGLIYALSGISQYPDFYPYKNYFKSYIITSDKKFRPDKIAFELFGAPELSWVLDCVNTFYHDEEYYIGRKIQYVDRDVLTSMGIL